MGAEFVDLLAGRGITTQEAAEEFLFPSLSRLTDPYKFSGVKEIVDRVRYAVSAGETIVVFGDYDCDGISGVYILTDYLRSVGAKVHYFIPNREEDGYGLTDQAIEFIAETYFPDLIITVDCGISGHDEIEYAKELGMDVVVTDHHELPEVLPECPIFNTKQDAGREYFMHCGAGTAFMLVLALGGMEKADKYLDVAAIATVGDIVPLTGDNRILVAEGLKKLNSRDCNPGVKQFFEKVGVNKIASGDIAFKLVPGINAFGRLGDAKRALELYTTSDRFVLMGVIDRMLEVNAERKQLCLDLEEHVVEKLQNCDFSQIFGICLYDMRWIGGVLGIAAAYVVERYARPTILFTEKDGMLKGSGRSTDRVDLLDAIRACEDLTEGYGGHKQAAGVTLKKENFDAFSRRFNEYVASKYGHEDFVLHKGADMELVPGKVNYDYVRKLDMLEPCGYGNPRPRFHVNATMGKCIPFKNNPLNFRYSFGEEFAVPVFTMQGKSAIFASNGVVKDMVLEFRLNHFNGNVYVDATMNACKFLPGTKDDRLNARSIMNAVADDSVLGRAKKVSVDALDKLMNGFGTLLVAYDDNTLGAISDLITSKNLPVYSGDLFTHNPVDCVLTHPVGRVDVSNYSRVVLLDLPMLSTDGNVEFLAAYAGTATLDIPKELATRETLISAFREVSQKIRAGCVVEDLIGAKSDLSRTFAYFVFRELGIIREDDARPHLTDVKSNLTDSKLFNFVQNN